MPVSCECCVVRYRSLLRADHFSREVLLRVVCMSVIEETHGGGLGALGLSNHERERENIFILSVLKLITT